MAVLGIVPAEERSTERLGLALIPERPGNEGWYFKVLTEPRKTGWPPAQRAGARSARSCGALAVHPRQGQDPGLDAMLQAALLINRRPGPSSPGPPPSSPRRSGCRCPCVEVVIAPLFGPSSRVISQDHTWFGAVAINSGLVLGMGALRPAFLNRHLGGQNTIHRAFAAQVDLFVEQRGHHLGG